MARVTRSAAALLAALAIASLPMLVDRCAELCSADHVAAAPMPSCHHAAPSGTHVGHVPPPCGHDHHAPVVTAVNTAAPDSHPVESIVPTAIVRAERPFGDVRHLVVRSSPASPSDPVAHARPLRL